MRRVACVGRRARGNKAGGMPEIAFAGVGGRGGGDAEPGQSRGAANQSWQAHVHGASGGHHAAGRRELPRSGPSTASCHLPSAGAFAAPRRAFARRASPDTLTSFALGLGHLAPLGAFLARVYVARVNDGPGLEVLWQLPRGPARCRHWTGLDPTAGRSPGAESRGPGPRAGARVPARREFGRAACRAGGSAANARASIAAVGRSTRPSPELARPCQLRERGPLAHGHSTLPFSTR